ncbi:MAG TPA: VOC family protein, partial [Acidimicrobiales bacterium]|nr:VOC family protein [Acidimicrobiales bacterium]
MVSRIHAITFLAHDPAQLATFWSAALGWPRLLEGGRNVLVPSDETNFPVVFVDTNSDKRARNRIHFDLTTTSPEDQNATVRRLLDLDAVRCDVGQGSEVAHVVLADPEDNEFCVIEPANSFLATCPRLGAINCDGTKETGYFWSEVLGWPLIW